MALKVAKLKVAKFGGTSLAQASQVAKVRSIIEQDPARRFVVVSAPGKRSSDDQKITDILYLCHELASQHLPIADLWHRVEDRFLQIASELKVDFDMKPDLDAARAGIEKAGADGLGPDFAASRGEYLNAKLIAALMGWEFVDAAELIKFDDSGRMQAGPTYLAAAEKLSQVERAVIPGFYGADPTGYVKTFSRGGSDVTGAIVARSVEADIYENWTDVSGLLMTDPRIVENPKPIQVITYRELRELSYMGASVLHEDAVFPVRQTAIPVNIRNTNRPEDDGTLIMSIAAAQAARNTPAAAISGIAGRKDFSVITVEKAMMNAEIGFGRKVLSVLEDHKVSFEHAPSGIDTLSVVVSTDSLKKSQQQVLDEIRFRVEPDSVEVEDGLALIATVGRGMARHPGTAATLFSALAKADVNVRLIDQGSSELNIIVGVSASDFNGAVKAIYHAFVD